MPHQTPGPCGPLGVRLGKRKKEDEESPNIKGNGQWVSFFLSFFFKLVLAALGLRWCAQAFSSCGEQGLLFVVVPRLLTALASLVAEHGL